MPGYQPRPQSASRVHVPNTNGNIDARGNRGPDPTHRSCNLAHLRRSYGLAVSHADLASGCSSPIALYSALRDLQWAPSGSHLSINNTQLRQLATSHGIHHNQRPPAGGAQLPNDDQTASTQLAPTANGKPPGRLATCPLNPNNGTVATFDGWDVPVVLRILSTIIQRLGGRRKGEEPTGLLYPYACDISRVYCARAEPRGHTARILNTITCWAQPELVDLAIHQTFQQLLTTVPTVAREPNRKDLPVSTDVPSNPRIALEIFVRLHGLQREQTRAVGEEYARGIQTFKQLFTQHGHQELADGLPNLEPTEAIPGISGLGEAASDSPQTVPPTSHLTQDTDESLMEGVQDDISNVMPPSEEPLTDNNFTFSDAATPVRDEAETGISNMEAADIESELNNLLTMDEESSPPSEAPDSAVQNTVNTMASTSTQEAPQDQLLE